MEFVIGGVILLALIWFLAAVGQNQSDKAKHAELGRLLAEAKRAFDPEDMSRLRLALIELEVVADAQVKTKQLSEAQARRMLMDASIQTIHSYREIDRVFSTHRP